MQRNSATARRAGKFKPTIRGAGKGKHAEKAQVEGGNFGEVFDVENDARDLWGRKIFWHEVKIYRIAKKTLSRRRHFGNG